jgi:ubiquinone/menaquinone biosynthesis C-methylase UbiE
LSQLYFERRSRYSAVSSLLNNCTEDNCLFLDAGCGTGDNILNTSHNLERIGVDILRINTKVSKARRNDSYVVADLSALPFKGGSFNGVLCFDVLEHVDNKNSALNEFRRITKVGGFLVGCTTNLANPVLLFDSKMSIFAKPLVKKFSYPGDYERHGRLSPSGLYKALLLSKYSLDLFVLVGVPQFEASRFHLFLYLWICLDKLSSNRFSCYLKEMMLWKATSL